MATVAAQLEFSSQAGTQTAADNAGTAAQNDFANAAANAVQSGVTT
jgi:hypothetical protein